MRILHAKDISLAILLAQTFGKSVHLSPTRVATLVTAVSELTSNVIKYAQHGLISFRSVEMSRQTGIEVVVQDRGPGIADIERAMKDHYSSSGTLGLGLPGTRRMVDEFELQSAPGQGTTVRIVLWNT